MPNYNVTITKMADEVDYVEQLNPLQGFIPRPLGRASYKAS